VSPKNNVRKRAADGEQFSIFAGNAGLNPKIIVSSHWLNDEGLD
jgi:hypothetical protein